MDRAEFVLASRRTACTSEKHELSVGAGRCCGGACDWEIFELTLCVSSCFCRALGAGQIAMASSVWMRSLRNALVVPRASSVAVTRSSSLHVLHLLRLLLYAKLYFCCCLWL